MVSRERRCIALNMTNVSAVNILEKGLVNSVYFEICVIAKPVFIIVSETLVFI